MSSPPGTIRSRALHLSEGMRARPYGSVLASQNLVYLLYLPGILGICGALVYLAPTDAMFLLGALVGSLVGLYVLADVMFRELPLRLTTLYAMALLLGYNLGALNSWLTAQRGSLTLAESFARDPEALGRAIAACMAAAAVLFVVGELYERPIFGKDFFLRFGPSTLPIVSCTTLLIVGAYATGRIGYMGIAVDESHHVDPATELIMWWYVPAFAYSVCATLNTRGLTRLWVGILTLIQTLALVPFGRSRFAFSLLLAMIATRLGRHRFRMPIYKRLLIGVLGLALILIASVTFLYLRVAGYDHKGKISTAARLGSAYELLNKRSPLEVLAMFRTDASTRTFMIGFFSDLLDASQRSTPLMGKDILYNVEMAVPSIISRDKFETQPYPEEALANIQWGFAYLDEANSLITAGAADFGFIGVLLYPIVLIFILRIVLERFQFLVPTNLAVIVALGYIFQCLHAEDVPVAYLLQIRNTILVAVGYYVLSQLPIFRPRSRNDVSPPPDWRLSRSRDTPPDMRATSGRL